MRLSRRGVMFQKGGILQKDGDVLQKDGDVPREKMLSADVGEGSRDECRICFEYVTPEKEILSPCQCSGTIKYVHKECFDKYLEISRVDRCNSCGSRFANPHIRFRPNVMACVIVLFFVFFVLVPVMCLFTKNIIALLSVSCIFIVLGSTVLLFFTWKNELQQQEEGV
jgi:E3 ubiquitin-protein ligase DOA10